MIARVMESIVDDPGLAPYSLVGRPEALRREGLFAVEGRLVLPRLLASRYRVHSVLLSQAARDSVSAMLAPHPGTRVLVAPAETISDIAGFNFHRGCLALGYRAAPLPIDQLLAADPGGATGQPILVLESVSNPDNVGGLFRSAHALGARGIVLSPGCGDPLYRKAIRTSMGATLDVAWTEAAAWPGALDEIRAAGYRIVALATDEGARPLRDVVIDSSAPIAFLLGSEGHGLTEAALKNADAVARIPMQHGADSLNVASAGSIALYEVMNS
jgi:tRNA G18 (ribose-2'-O)-methylase SpoU